MAWPPRLAFFKWIFVFIVLYVVCFNRYYSFTSKKSTSSWIYNSIALDPVIVDENIADCFIDGQKCQNLTDVHQYRFGLFNDQFMQLQTSNSSEVILLSKNSISLMSANSQGSVIFNFSRMQRREHYWLITGYDNLSEIRLPFSSIISVGLHKFWSYQIKLPFSHIPLNVNNSVKLSDLKLLSYRLKHSKFIDCKKDLSTKLRNETPEIYWENNTIIHPSYVKTLAKLIDFMYQIELYPVMTSGTLLGWYRECSILPHTGDIDFMVFSKSMELKKKIRIMEISKHLPFCKWDRSFGVLNETYQELFESRVFCKNIRIDFFTYYNDGNISWIGGSNGKQKLRWIFPFIIRDDDVCTAELLGYLFFVPCDVESFLVSVYGNQWYNIHHTKSYDWLHSPKNVEFGDNWS